AATWAHEPGGVRPEGGGALRFRFPHAARRSRSRQSVAGTDQGRGGTGGSVSRPALRTSLSGCRWGRGPGFSGNLRVEGLLRASPAAYVIGLSFFLLMSHRGLASKIRQGKSANSARA